LDTSLATQGIYKKTLREGFLLCLFVFFAAAAAAAAAATAVAAAAAAASQGPICLLAY
jgi:hypothetical protein